MDIKTRLMVNELKQNDCYAKYRALYIAKMSAQQFQFDEELLSKYIDKVKKEMIQNTNDRENLLREAKYNPAKHSLSNIGLSKY